MIALAYLLGALRRLPARVLHGCTQLGGLGGAGLLDRLLEQEEQPVGVGCEQIGIALELLLEAGDEILVGGRIDVDRIAGSAEEAFGCAAHGADDLLGHRSCRARKRQLIAENPVLLELREQAHGVVPGSRRHDHVRPRRPDLTHIGGEILGAERRIGRADIGAAETLDVVLESPDRAAAHLVVRPDEEVAPAGDVLDQPRRQCVRLHERIGIDTKDVRVALRPGDRRSVRYGRDQDAIVAFSHLADRKGRAAVHRPGQQIDLVLLKQLFRFTDRDRRVGLLVLEQQLERPPVHATRGVDLLDRQLRAPAHLLADRGVASGERRDHSHLDRIGGLGERDQSNRQRADCAHAHHRYRLSS